MYSTYFQEWLSEAFKPSILVYSSELAKTTIKKNNLSPADFLRPLGDFTGKRLEIPFSDSEITSISNFQIDFYDNDKYRSIQRGEIRKYIESMFVENTPIWELSTASLNKNKKSIGDILSKLKYYSSPWLREYEKTLFECLSFDEYELYQQPLINIFLCTSLDEASIITNLINVKENIPDLILKQIYDPAQENLIIILNDLSDVNYTKMSSEQKEQNISKFKTKYSNYSIINWDINTKENSQDEKMEISQIYQKYFHKLDMYNPNNDFYRNKENKYGIYITNENIKKYKDDFFEYFQNFIKTNLNNQINGYLEIIQNNSGIMNSIFSFSLLRREEISYYPNTKIYRLSELEKAYYNLGTINFFFHNYNSCFENLQILRGMIKDKSKNHIERIKVLITISKFITTFVKKEFDFVYEMIGEITLEQMIKNELIIIKMYENNENLGHMIGNILNFIVATKQKFIKNDKNGEKSENNNTKRDPVCFEYLYPLLYEKISIYYINHNFFRKFQMFMAFAGESYNELPDLMKLYSLNSLSYLLNVLDEPDSSFNSLKLYYNNILSDISKKINYWEPYFKFSKNCFELLIYQDGEKNTELEKKYFSNYLDSVEKVQNNSINCSNTELNSLEIPQIDNSSLFILEENDYNIKALTEQLNKLYKNEKAKFPLTWNEFNKYSERLVENYYVYLLDSDLLCIKMLYDLSHRKLGEMINIKNRNFRGNINQKLYVNINIKNPLTIDLEMSSIKLYCEFLPDSKFISNDSNNNSTEKYLKYSEENITLKSLEDIDVLLNIESNTPGKMVIKGIEFIIFNKCKIIHLFSKKNRKRLYFYKPKYIINYFDDISSYQNLRASTSATESFTSGNYNIENRRKMSSMYKKRKIIYEIRDLSQDLYLSFPKGDEINVYLYQLILFPISITNNSTDVKIKRFSIFLENSDDKKIKTFFKYITKKIFINQKHNNEVVLIPFIPLALGDIFVKIIVKFEDEIRIKPVEIKRAMIKINVTESILFELKENCNNFSINKNQDIYNPYDILNFNIKTDLRIANKENLSNLSLNKPIFNPNKFNLLETKDYLITNEEIHQKYTLQKFYNMNDELHNIDKNNTQYNFDFIKEEIQNSNYNTNTNEHVIEKLNKSLNNINDNLIFFPWNAFEEKGGQKNKINGLYPYNIKLKGPEPSKSAIRELFFNSTKIEIIKQKMSLDRTLVIILLTLNKSELITFNNTIEKYDIFVDKNNPEINWIGTHKYTIRNRLEENKDKNIFKCKFSFITSLKGLIEVNRISALLYKKIEGLMNSIGSIVINHITKPLSIYLD